MPSYLELYFAEFLKRLDPSADPVVLRAGTLLSESAEQGRAYLELTKLNVELLDASLSSSSKLVAKPERPSLGNAPLVLDGRRLYLRRYWDAQRFIDEWVRSRSQAGGGWFKILTGGPGSGKTTRLLHLADLFKSSFGMRARIRLAAPTGKAAARLNEAAGQFGQAVTIHSLLGANLDGSKFRFNQNNPLGADLVIIDEASMIGLELMVALLKALRLETSLLLAGDKDQLTSVEAGSVFADLCERGPNVTVLTTQYRFGVSSGIGQLSRAVNRGAVKESLAILRDRHTYPDLDVVELPAYNADVTSARLEKLAVAGYRDYLDIVVQKRPPSNSAIESYQHWAQEVLNALNSFRILSPLRRGARGTEGLNKLFALALYKAGLLNRASGWYEGRPVLVTKNEYELGLRNGDLGVVLNMPTEGVEQQLMAVFRRSDGTLYLLKPNRISSLEAAYALTVHKAQGSEFARVALVLPPPPNSVLTRRMLYTAITRASAHFSLCLANLDDIGIILNETGNPDCERQLSTIGCQQ